MIKRFIYLLICFVAINHNAFAQERLSIDKGWRFHLGDISEDVFPGGEGARLYGPDITHSGSKAGHAWGAAARGFDDSSWRKVDLPHDWGVEQPFDEKAQKAQGYRARGVAWYRKTFSLSTADMGRNIELQFDGVATHSTVYFNGTPVSHNWNGYTSFTVDVSSMARYGNNINTIAVRVDAEPMEGWWYEGAGIYRHTWLVKRNPVHIITDGVYANPVKGEHGNWSVPVEVTLANKNDTSGSASVDLAIFDAEGRQVASGGSAPIQMNPYENGVVHISVPVQSPNLWSVEQPTLYKLKTSIVSNGKQIDSASTNIGFRTLRFDAKDGFFLNDKPVKLQGTSNHQDHAGVGVAVPDSLWEFRLKKLKEMGSNAYRTAHNPPAKELLDAADRLGMLVMDETRQFNSTPEYLAQLEWLVRRDRNHPSVIIWSLFNEEGLEVNKEGMEIARTMNAWVKRFDVTRPTTGAQNRGQLNADGSVNPENAAWSLDLVGINYQASEYDKIRAAYPNKPMLSTEDTSQVMTRGEYESNFEKNIIASYDEVFPGWDNTSSARNAWEAIAKQPSFAGGFSWTGFAYRGEPTPFGWPAASSFFGAMDLCGFPKTEFYIRQALWTKDKPVLRLEPHWDWPNKKGQNIKVMAITNADSVKLLLNGKVIGEKAVEPFKMAEWQVPYAPGTLQAVAFKNGKQVATFKVETTGAPVALKLTPDRKFIHATGSDAVPITVEVVDAKGRSVPTASTFVTFKVSGVGKSIGLGNGDPNSHEDEKGNTRSLFNGLAQLIVQADETEGNVIVEASAEGVRSAKLVISVKKVFMGR